jgi:excisionase family DNA binding protein
VAGTQPSTPVRLLLTVPEVASALGVCRNVVYELVLTGQLASIKIGRLRRVPIGALETFINAQLTTVEGRRS